MRRAKALLRRSRRVTRRLWWAVGGAGYRLLHRWRLRFESPEQTFSRYARENTWRDGESLSGPGSTLRYTENLRARLPDLVRRRGVETFFDAPCGDFHWMKEVPFPESMHYIGADIVDSLVRDNQRQYGSARRRFAKMDITRDALPAGVDLWFCRDALFHLSDRDIRRALQRFLESDARFLMTSVHTACTKNTDILTGDFRLLNLLRPPWNLPEPEEWVRDCVPGFPERSMGLWPRAALEAQLRDDHALADAPKQPA